MKDRLQRTFAEMLKQKLKVALWDHPRARTFSLCKNIHINTFNTTNYYQEQRFLEIVGTSSRKGTSYNCALNFTNAFNFTYVPFDFLNNVESIHDASSIPLPSDSPPDTVWYGIIPFSSVFCFPVS